MITDMPTQDSLSCFKKIDAYEQEHHEWLKMSLESPTWAISVKIPERTDASYTTYSADYFEATWTLFAKLGIDWPIDVMAAVAVAGMRLSGMRDETKAFVRAARNLIEVHKREGTAFCKVIQDFYEKRETEARLENAV